MAKKVFKATLSTKSIRQLQDELRAYRDSLPLKCEEFVKRLSDEGIDVAKTRLATQKADSNGVNYADYITFTVETKPSKTGCTAVMVATNTGIVQSEWRTSEGIKTADVSPLLMCEFGSGRRAENPLNVPGVGQGTFPGQTHAFQKEGWFWKDLNGEWHHSLGVTPSAPMYSASIAMREKIIKVAREVFGGA